MSVRPEGIAIRVFLECSILGTPHLYYAYSEAHVLQVQVTMCGASIVMAGFDTGTSRMTPGLNMLGGFHNVGTCGLSKGMSLCSKPLSNAPQYFLPM